MNVETFLNDRWIPLPQAIVEHVDANRYNLSIPVLVGRAPKSLQRARFRIDGQEVYSVHLLKSGIGKINTMIVYAFLL